MNYKLYESSHRVMIKPIITSKRGLRSSLSLMDSKWMRKSITKNSELLVFSDFVGTSAKGLNLVTLLFPPFWRDFIFWKACNEGTAENAIKNTVYIFWRLCNSAFIFPKSYIKFVITLTHSSRRVLCIRYFYIFQIVRF